MTTNDVSLAEKMYGKDVPTIKGKSTNKKGKVIVDERIELPEELESGDKNLELAMDILFVDMSRGQLRMVVDCRRSNRHFADLDPVSFCTG